MRPRDAFAPVVLVCLLVAGCSRLTFIKPDTDRGGYTQVTPDYDIRESPDDKRRMGLLDALGLAGLALQRGDLDSAETRRFAPRSKIDRNPRTPTRCWR